ncbi:MAG TPA: SPOR domain-containing protein [Azospira sp.]|nr:SPOR domain-containing protein [Azospira sp.]
MRALVFLLVLANLLFLAFAQGFFGAPGNPDGERVKQQVQAEKITVVGRGDPPEAKPATSSEGAAAPKAEVAAAPPPVPVETKATETKAAETKVAEAKAAEAKAAEAKAAEAKAAEAKAAEAKAADNRLVCLAWNDLAAADADRLSVLAANKYAGLAVSRASATDATQFWVFIPPLASRQDADRKAGELKKLGVSEFFVVQEAGPNRWAISLGIFSTEQAARDQLEALREQGVRSAKVGPRPSRSAPVRLEVRGKAALMEGFKAAAAGAVSQVRPETCPAAKAGAKAGSPG